MKTRWVSLALIITAILPLDTFAQDASASWRMSNGSSWKWSAWRMFMAASTHGKPS